MLNLRRSDPPGPGAPDAGEARPDAAFPDAAFPVLPQRRRRPRPPVVTAAVLAATVAGFAGSWLWLFDLIAQFRPHLVLVAGVTAAVAALRRRPLATGLAVLAVLANLAVIVPLYLGRPTVPAGAPTLTIAHINMRRTPGDSDGFRAFLTDQTADVVVILEPRQHWRRDLGPTIGPYRLYKAEGRVDTTWDGDRAWVASRVPVRDVLRPTAPELPDASVEFTISPPGTPEIRVLGIHTTSPGRRSESARRDRQFDAVATWRSAQAAGPVIVVGDLNATPWSGPFRGLVDRTGLQDARAGFGMVPTWPIEAGPLGLPIDQSLHTPDLVTTAVATGPSLGSNHRAFVVTYALT